MTIEIKFTFDDDPFSRENIKRILAAEDSLLAIDNIKGVFRSLLKYGEFRGKSLELSEDTITLLENIQTEIHELCEKLPKDE